MALGRYISLVRTAAATGLAILAVTAILIRPAFAADSHSVTRTFRLTLYGKVPAGQSFSVDYNYNHQSGSLWMCGGPSAPKCVGNGTVYTESAEFPKGVRLTVHWTRWIPGDPEGNPFYNETATLNSDTTSSAWFRYGGSVRATSTPTTEQPTNETNIPTGLPPTGGGGAENRHQSMYFHHSRSQGSWTPLASNASISAIRIRFTH